MSGQNRAQVEDLTSCQVICLSLNGWSTSVFRWKTGRLNKWQHRLNTRIPNSHPAKIVTKNADGRVATAAAPWRKNLAHEMAGFGEHHPHHPVRVVHDSGDAVERHRQLARAFHARPLRIRTCRSGWTAAA